MWGREQRLHFANQDRRQLEPEWYRDGPEHVIIGGRQEGKTTLAIKWLIDGIHNSIERVLIVHNDDYARQLKADNHFAANDPRIISYRQLLNSGARKGVEYGIDEMVTILTSLLKLNETPHLVTVVHAAWWQAPDD
jgi:hypothetical protein